MTTGRFILLTMLLAAACGPAGCGRGPDGPAPVIAVGSSYLQCAVRDLWPAAPVLALAEPGMCPGHFDIRPAQVRQLRACRLLLRFDFQGGLDRQLEGSGCRTTAIKAAGGLCEPETYLAVCRQVAQALVEAGLIDQAGADARVAAIAQRLEPMRAELLRQLEAAGLAGAPVIASSHQAAFCRRLGLRVVATIGGADATSIREVDSALAQARREGCRLVIANRPEGTQLAESIADRLEARLVVFDNFPTLSGSQTTFDGLLRDNVRQLLTAGRP